MRPSGSGRKKVEVREEPEGESRREAPGEQLWERSREGRKETNREPSTKKRKGSTGNRVERKWRSQETERRRGSTEEDPL